MAAVAKTCFQPHTCQQMALPSNSCHPNLIWKSALQNIFAFSVSVSKNSSRKQMSHQAPLKSHFYNTTWGSGLWISNSNALLSDMTASCSNSWAKLHCYPHFPSFTPIKPRSGCHHPSSNLDWTWNWLAVGNGLPCNDFVWPIVSTICSLLSLFSVK